MSHSTSCITNCNGFLRPSCYDIKSHVANINSASNTITAFHSVRSTKGDSSCYDTKSHDANMDAASYTITAFGSVRSIKGDSSTAKTNLK